MQSIENLQQKLDLIDGKDYGGYQSLKGDYNFSSFQLSIRQIPKDPYAPPHTGIYCLQVNRNDAFIINPQIDSNIREIAFRDYLTRRFYQASVEISKSQRGTGYSGVITINQPGQAILDRNSIVMNQDMIEVRCFLGLPASGRQINAKIASKMLFQELPQIVEQALFEINIDKQALEHHLQTAADAQFLREKLETLGLVSFIADQAVLPRKSGTNDHPMNFDKAVRFKAPESLKVNIDLPHAGTISGMGIPKGVTLIVGGGYNGKSTLLNALERGCYNHLPGDGREQCVSIDSTVKVRAYSGRNITNTCITPFIHNLPFQKDTDSFSSENASGSTSQAASIVESIEMGAEVLLMDEDTCATNFMIRDTKMQQLVHKDDEPITPFIDRVRLLYEEKGISTILVLGGVGDYFDVSDHVIQMNQYQAMDVTLQAKIISKQSSVKRVLEGSAAPFAIRDRIPISHSIDPRNHYGKKGIYAKETHRLTFGTQTIDLTDLEQLVELSQTKAIGHALDYARRYMDEKRSLNELISLVLKDIDDHGLDVLSDHISGHFAKFRSFEMAFAINRLRGLGSIHKNMK